MYLEHKAGGEEPQDDWPYWEKLKDTPLVGSETGWWAYYKAFSYVVLPQEKK